jgi:hypothetical protein
MSSARRDFWTPAGRFVLFTLAASSIACLLGEFYGLWKMKTFALCAFVPSCALIGVIAAIDHFKGNGRLARLVWIGVLAGLVAAVAYDIFRLPFVFSRPLHLASIVPPLDLFKVFPRFGAMLLGQAIDQPGYSVAAQILGWTYHFSNGATFGVMYVALLGNPARRHWAWGIAMALALEAAMLLTPYTSAFNVPLTATFVVVTLVAHTVFGIVLGRRVANRTQEMELTPASAS